MATRQKLVKFAFEPLASLTNNTLTNLTQTHVYIPESGVTFRSVTARVTFDDIVTATGGSLTTKTLGLQLGAAGYSSVANANTLSHSSANLSFYLTADYTSYFVTNWSGTSMTCDFQVTINQSTGTTLGMVNVCVTLDITYDYDDTSATQIKTIEIPLATTVGALTTTPTTYDTIPALGYYLAEPSKAIRNVFVVLAGSESRNTNTSTHTIGIGVGAATQTTGNYTGATGGVDRRFRYVWELSASWPSTTATQTFQLSDTVGRNNHLQAWLVITYEFKADNATTTLTAALTDGVATTVSVTSAAALGTAPYVIAIENEQMLVTSVSSNDLTVTRGYNGTTGVAHANAAVVTPCGTNGIRLSAGGLVAVAGGTTNGDYQRFSNKLYVEEPGPITANKVAFFIDWEASDVSAGLNMRVGVGSFVAYTMNVGGVSGSVGAMVRNDAAYTLGRGANTLTFDIYRTDTSSNKTIQSPSGYWLITYVSAKSAQGYGAHNHTVGWNLQANGTAAAAAALITTIASTAPAIPESDYYLSNVGVECIIQGSAASQVQPSQINIQIERLAGEGGIRWDSAMLGRQNSDAKTGVFVSHCEASKWLKRWPADTDFERMDIETARRWRIYCDATVWYNVQLYFSYHTCGPFAVGGSVTSSDAGTVTIGLHRTSDGQLLKSTTRVGNGAYSFNWWDNTEQVFAEAIDASGDVGRSVDNTAAGSP